MSTDEMTNAVALPQIANLLQTLSLEAETAAREGNRETQLSIMEGILSADTIEEMFDRQEAGAVSSKDFLNVPFRVMPEGIAWKRSNIAYVEQGGFPFYALLNVTTMDGERAVIDTGSPSCIAILAKLMDLDAFEQYREDGGFPLQFVGKPVSSGNTVVLLKPVSTAPRRGNKKA